MDLLNYQVFLIGCVARLLIAEIVRFIIYLPGYRNLSLKSSKCKINLSVKVILKSNPKF